MHREEHRVVLSKNPYLQRTRLKDEFDRFSNLRPSARPQRKTLEMRPMQHSELQAKLLAVCDSLQAKNTQCKFLIEENEYLNQRLLELSKGKYDNEQLEIASEGLVQMRRGKENVCCQELKKELDNAIQLNEQLQRERRQSAAKTSISTKSIQVIHGDLTNRSNEAALKQQIFELSQQISRQKFQFQTILDEKNNMVEMLNASLLGAIETSSKLMGQKCELSNRLEESSHHLKEIQSLYVNAKQFIFKGMENSQSEVESQNDSVEQDQTQLEIFRQKLSQKERDLQATRYLLDVKIKQCEEKEDAINSLKNYQTECSRLEVLARKLAHQLTQLKRIKGDSAEDKLSRAFTTIQTEVGYCRRAFQFYQNLGSNTSLSKCRAGETIKRRYEEFRNSIAQEFEQVCSTLIVKKMEIDQFTKQLYSELKTQDSS